MFGLGASLKGAKKRYYSLEEAGPGQDGLSGQWANVEGAKMACSGRQKVNPLVDFDFASRGKDGRSSREKVIEGGGDGLFGPRTIFGGGTG